MKRTLVCDAAEAAEVGDGSSCPDAGVGGGSSPELESLVGQTLEELVRDAMWGLPTHAPPADAAGAYIDDPLTPQVWTYELHSSLHRYCGWRVNGMYFALSQFCAFM